MESKAVSRRNAGVTTLGRLYQFHLRRGNAERFSSRPIRRVKIHFRPATAAVAERMSFVTIAWHIRVTKQIISDTNGL